MCCIIMSKIINSIGMFCGSFVNKDSSLININNNSAVPCINNQILSMSGKRFMGNKTVPGAVICVIFKNALTVVSVSENVL